MNEIGNKIKKLRTDAKITQEELSQALQVSTQAVSKWENGGSPDIEMIPLIAKYFNVTTDYLFGISNNNFSDIEKKICSYISSLKVEEQIEKIYELGYLMSVAAYVEDIDLSEYDYKKMDGDFHSEVIDSTGIIMTSLEKDNLFFTCFPKNKMSDFNKILKTKEKQIEFCKLLSNKKYYEAIILIFSKQLVHFTPNLFIDTLGLSYDESILFLDELCKFRLVSCSKVPVDGKEVTIYTPISSPEIVGLITFLDMIVNKPNSWYFYRGGKSNYFEKTFK